MEIRQLRFIYDNCHRVIAPGWLRVTPVSWSFNGFLKIFWFFVVDFIFYSKSSLDISVKLRWFGCFRFLKIGRRYSRSPSSSPRGYSRRYRSPSPRDGYRSRGRDYPTSLLVRNLRHDCRWVSVTNSAFFILINEYMILVFLKFYDFLDSIATCLISPSRHCWIIFHSG